MHSYKISGIQRLIFVLSIKFDPCLGLRVQTNMFSYCENIPRWIREIPGHLKAEKMCDEGVGIEPRSLAFFPDRLKTEKMCNEAVGMDAYTLGDVPDYIMTQKISNEVMRKNPAAFFLSMTILKHKKCVSRPLK